MYSPPTPSGSLKKQDSLSDLKADKRDVKPVPRTLNRVPRACNACRKQKMRCEGADNPPCRRCRNTGLECLFEKPSREATLTGEAGLERIRNLEALVFDIRQSQASTRDLLLEIQAQLRAGSMPARSPSAFIHHHQSPSMHSPAVSATPPGSMQQDSQSSPVSGSHSYPPTTSSARSSRPPLAGPSQSGQPYAPSRDYGSQLTPTSSMPYGSQGYASGYTSNQGPVLPPFSSLQADIGHNTSSVRFRPPEQDQPHPDRMHADERKRPAQSRVDSSGAEDDDDGVLPASGLVAPWEVLRGLADVATERAARENGDSSESQSRPRSPASESQPRPLKKRKIRHNDNRAMSFPDVVTKGIITEAEARDLFRIFYHGCSTFLPVFDSRIDTYDTLHERSSFAVDCICMVAARVRDGGGKSSETYKKCLEEVQAVSCATLFSPVASIEAVQAMILVSGWSDNGWLSGGHAVRMALELSLHKAWPALLKRMDSHSGGDPEQDRELVIASRTWFCLYLFEHQLSYGTGRPAILKDDDSIAHCRLILRHPLAIEDDMRLVSTVELMALRERLNNNMSPVFESVRDQDFEELRRADAEFKTWFATWDQAFSQKYEDAAFYRQSLQIQHLHAELFHNAIALRGINGPEDVQNMPPAQRNLAIRSIQIARQGLDITVNSPAYAEGMKYAVHYTHATATFAASFLLRLARLFPHECRVDEIRVQVERLAVLMSGIPGRRYALTLQVMLKRFQKRRMSSSRSPTATRDLRAAAIMGTPDASGHPDAMQYSPTYQQQPVPQHSQQQPYSRPGPQGSQQMVLPQHANPQMYATEADTIWSGYETTANEQLPVWMSDQTLGGNTFGQDGMNAFLLPANYLPPTQQIW